MKKIYSHILLIATLFFQNKISAQSANKNLSNLTAPTALNVNLLPKNNDLQNLGSTTKAWHALYLRGSIFLDGQKFISNSGNENTFIGSNSGETNTTGFHNTAIGHNAMLKNKIGFSNVAIGNGTMRESVNGYRNVAVGDSALLGSSGQAGVNVAVGYKTLYSNTNGYFNTAQGGLALYSNTTGVENTANGAEVLYYNVTGSRNTAMGYRSLYTCTGDDNTAYGYFTLNANTGINNTAVGSHALQGTTGNNNCAFGYNARLDEPNISNASAIGYEAYAYTSNQMEFGNESVTSIGGNVDWTTISDGRVKKNIKQDVPGLAFINKLQPVTYNLNLDAEDKIIRKPVLKDADGKIIQPLQSDIDARIAQGKIIYTGFIAQEVEKAAKSLHYDFSGVDFAKNEHGLYGLRYGAFVVPLVKAVQELSSQNDSLQSEIQNLKSEIAEIKNMIGLNQLAVNGEQLAVVSSASLEQNVPNPFKNATNISYTLSHKFSSAQIVITDKSGKVLKAINISGTKGNVSIDASMLSSGAYQYSLIVDGRMIGSKQMILSK